MNTRIKVGEEYILLVNPGRMVVGTKDRQGKRPKDIIVNGISIREIFKDRTSYENFLSWLRDCLAAVV